MSQYVPLALADATLTVWRADAAGEPTGDPLFLGCPVSGVQMAGRYTEVLSASSGRSYRRARHVDEEHALSLDRTWMLRANDAAQDPFARHTEYVLAIAWTITGPAGEGGRWTKTRTYYGVTWQEGLWGSVGQHMFGLGQRFRAQRFTEVASLNDTPSYGPVPDFPTGEQYLLLRDASGNSYRLRVVLADGVQQLSLERA